MDEKPVLYERIGRLGIITLNRPEKLNSINGEMQELMREAYAEIRKDDRVRVAVLRGRGRAFSAGADISSQSGVGAEQAAARRALSVTQDRQGRIDGILNLAFLAWDHPKPVISQIHGYCLGIANVIATLTDMKIVAEDAQIGWPSLPMGGGFISPIWSWWVGPTKAKELSMRIGITMSGLEAVSLGWANKAVPADQLEEATMAFANDIAKTSSDLLNIKKAAINHQMEAQGFRHAVHLAGEMDAIAHTTWSAQYVRRMMAEDGMKAAFDWWKASDGVPDPE